jgi:hypothetical protein
MEILWPALGIAVIVVFVFYVLAQHWRRILRQQTRAIRRLNDRVQDLEEMADPELRRRVGDAAPMPLEQVVTFSLRFADRFWRDTLRASAEDRRFMHECGSFLGSVKLERWRSHTVASITEVLPARKSAAMQTRTLDFYPDRSDRSQSLTLWELAVARPTVPEQRPPSLELLLRDGALELRAPLAHAAPEKSGNGHGHSPHFPEALVLLRLALDPAQLSEYRARDPEEAAPDAFADVAAAQEASTGAVSMAGLNSWQAFYSGSDEALGIEWHLRLRDLGKKAEWDRWRIWDARAVPTARD